VIKIKEEPVCLARKETRKQVRLLRSLLTVDVKLDSGEEGGAVREAGRQLRLDLDVESRRTDTAE
jgi:hypothetical protein